MDILIHENNLENPQKIEPQKVVTPKVRIALLGVGNMGHKYAEMITAGAAEHMILSAVVIRKSNLMEWGRELTNTDGSHPLIYPDTDELFSHSEEYDAVLIVTPHKTHPKLAQRAFALGKHVMCDKPAGAVIGDAIAMAEAAEKSGKIYAMMFHQRLYPKHLKLKEMLSSGELGTISRVMLVSSRYFRTAHYHSSAGWRSSWSGEGGGALINQGQHILDIWQWLFGMPQSIYAEIPYGKYNNFSVDDEATITMHYNAGMSAVFMLTTGEAVYEDRLEIIGTKGKILLEGDTLHIYRYSEDSTEYIRKADVNSRENLSVSEEIISFDKTKEPYPEMLENFAQAVISGDAAALVADGADAVNPLMLTNAAYYSAWKGQPVTLPLDADEYYNEYIRHMEN